MPNVIIIAGPNGAGKSTAAPSFLQGALHVDDFVNADTIAQGLCAFQPEKAAIAAGRIMLERIHLLGEQKRSFAFETTLASRSFYPYIQSLQKNKYQFHLIFLWLHSPEVAVARVQTRIQMGGHSIPPETILRRYKAGLLNFFTLYRHIATTWHLYNNSNSEKISLIASSVAGSENIIDSTVWNSLKEEYHVS